MHKSPNILYLHCHDAGRYLSPYGHAVPTPNLKAFADRATVFRQAFCANPTCSPSRAALLTGMYAHESGMLGLNHRGFQLNDHRQHLAYQLKENGYHTVLCGIEHELHPHVDQVYNDTYSLASSVTDEADDEYLDERVAGAASDWLSNHQDETPFFMSCGFFFPHREFPEGPNEFSPKSIKVPDPMPDTAETREDMSNYCAAVQIMDRAAGQVLEALAASRHADNTIVVFTVDHGIAFPFMKCNLTDSGIGVGLILDFPGNEKRGQVIDEMVSHVDVFPTLCELTGLEAPGYLRGTSLLPLFEAQSSPVREEIFAEVNYHAGYEPSRCIRTNRYKLIKRYAKDKRLNPVNVDDSPSKRLFKSLHFEEINYPESALYDLLVDPHERNNLARNPACVNVLKDLQSRLENWMRETSDPLLDGPIPLPEGAFINEREAYEPSPTGTLRHGPWLPE